ncbi:MAG: nuclease [Phormidesmis priestleyi]|uniref:Nuclease n=1 Tax=Phormidesmis priestleyi TaxID=268141 RepID=A0A2W4WCF4_9CYAN|nr:MAG: nuclease [Phormidesmis priestleyi]
MLLAGAISIKLSPKVAEQLTADVTPASSDISKHYNVVLGSIYDGDTLRVSDGNQEIKVRLCGLDVPEKEQAMGIESRDHLRSLVAQGNGRIILVETDTDQYGRTVAEAFIPTSDGKEEIHLNTQMVADGMAYVYPKYVGSCLNGSRMQVAEEAAKRQAIGVWSNPTSQKPWDYRRRS